MSYICAFKNRSIRVRPRWPLAEGFDVSGSHASSASRCVSENSLLDEVEITSVSTGSREVPPPKAASLLEVNMFCSTPCLWTHMSRGEKNVLREAARRVTGESGGRPMMVFNKRSDL